MINIQKKSKCCGCSACKNICPKNCISMVSDKEGFSYPKIDTLKCISCNLCEKVCPMLNDSTITDKRTAYACYNNDETIRLQSSSGGIFTLLAEKILSQGGVVFGASFDENFNVVHTKAETIAELSKFRGSKYVQSDINTTYKQAELFLKKGIKVLFSGTPCQINGLSNYLIKEYDNLLLVDCVCHGIPSPLIWNKYITFQKDKFSNDITEFSFRNKQKSWKNYSIFIKLKNNNTYTIPSSNDIFMKGFLSDLYLRPSCYTCNARGEHRVSDITLADFWGIQNILPELDDDKGTSLVITNTLKGTKIFKSIQDNMIYQTVDLDQAIKYNPSYLKSVTPNKYREKFFNEYNLVPFDVLIQKYGRKKRPFIRRILSKIKRLILKV